MRVPNPKTFSMPGIDPTGGGYRKISTGIGQAEYYKTGKHTTAFGAEYRASSKDDGKYAPRFNIRFFLGSIAASYADAKALITLVEMFLTERIPSNWRAGYNAGGDPFIWKHGEDDESVWSWAAPGRPIPKATLARYQGEALMNKFKTIRSRTAKARSSRAGAVARAGSALKYESAMRKQEIWMKETKAHFVWRGKVYIPKLGLPNGNYSGLTADSFRANDTRIRENHKTHAAPARVTVRFAVAAKRAEPVNRYQMMLMRENSQTWEEVERIMREVVEKTTVFGLWNQKRGTVISAAEYRYKMFFRQVAREARIGVIPRGTGSSPGPTSAAESSFRAGFKRGVQIGRSARRPIAGMRF